MAIPQPPVRRRELWLLTVLVATVIGLAWLMARDFTQSAENAGRLYQRLSDGLDLIDDLQFSTQEVRRILLYALHTSDANLQLQYVEQSRAADAHVQQVLDDAGTLLAGPDSRTLDEVTQAWTRYLIVRDNVIGLILEGSLKEGVAVDEHQGADAFGEVRQALAGLRLGFERDAARRVEDARARSVRATERLALLVALTLVAAAFAIYLINRRTALEGLLRSEAHKGTILQAVPDPVISIDAAGRMIELNAAAERAFGLSRPDALGAPLETVLPRDAVRGVLASGPNRAGAPAPRTLTIGQRRDGDTFPVELAAVSHTAGREPIWTLHVSDLTAHLRAEAELRRAKEAAEVADRAKSEFLATMSHELRTPLNGVVGIADLLQARDLAPAQRELVGMLRSSATALLGLVGDILDYTRIESGSASLTPAAFALRRCLEDALDTVTEAAARKGLEIGCALSPDVPAVVVADEARVRQVLINLLSNAVKFTDAGEVAVSVDAEPPDADGRRAIRVRVRDTGCGIPPQALAGLFTRFAQADSSSTRRYPGAGLGLAISRRLSHLLDGSLEVENTTASGSTFTFVFRAGPPPEPQQADPLAGSLAGVRVLAFLGTGIVAEQVGCLLGAWGASVQVVSDAGPPLPAPDGPPFDVILADGEALDSHLYRRAVRSRAGWEGESVPLLLVTRVLPSPARRWLPADGVLTKPVKADVLHEALWKAVETKAPGASQARPSPAPVPSATRALKVLLAEDDDANRRVLLLMLDELGLKADEAMDGLNAVERALSRHYDVILMDVRMPGLDGLDATRRIRAERGGPPPIIIALTASAMEGDEECCREAGMDGYLTKPVRLAALEAALSGAAGTPASGSRPAPR